MKELNEVKQAIKYLEIDAKTYADNFSASMIVSTKNILAIAEAFRDLEKRAEAAEAKLAELEKQKPIGRVDRGAATDSNEYPDARAICLHEHVGWEAFQDGAELFTRPAPAVSLYELVPDEMTWNEAHKLLNLASCGEDRFAAFMMGANWMRAAVLRNIEEAK